MIKETKIGHKSTFKYNVMNPRLKTEAEAVGLKERSPIGLVFSSESFAL
jgi:hypothetical protein